MEKPVRSFKSFVRHVPPPPTNDKPLPPAPYNSVLSSASGSTQKTRSGSLHSETSWRTPAEWLKGQHNDTGPSTMPDIPQARTYEPLLPEPSPNVSESSFELQPVFPAAKPVTERKMMPIIEHKESGLGSPDTPPRSPLPTPPTPKPSRLHSPPQIASPKKKGKSRESGKEKLAFGMSPSSSPRPFQSSQPSPPTMQEKASAFLGVESPIKSQSPVLQQYPASHQHHHRGKSLRRTERKNPLADGWEDEDMNEQERAISFSQDYHDLLIDQYRESTYRDSAYHPGEEPDSGLLQPTPHHASVSLSGVLPTPFHARHELVPRPLSWRKSSSNNSSPRSESRQRGESAHPESEKPETPTKEKKQRMTWVPRRLSVAPRKDRRESNETTSTSDTQGSMKSMTKRLFNKDDYRFPRFYIKSKKGKGKSPAPSAKERPAPPPQPAPSPSPLLRLPGTSLAIVRTTTPRSGSQSSASLSEPRSPLPRTSTSQVGSASPSERANSALSDSGHGQRDSCGYSDHSTSPSQRALPAVPSSQRYSGSPRESAATPPIHEELNKRTSRSVQKDQQNRSGLIDRMREARERRAREARQQKLKQSIHVLGPTDPHVVEGYVKREGEEQRVPGFMVGNRREKL